MSQLPMADVEYQRLGSDTVAFSFTKPKKVVWANQFGKCYEFLDGSRLDVLTGKEQDNCRWIFRQRDNEGLLRRMKRVGITSR